MIERRRCGELTTYQVSLVPRLDTLGLGPCHSVTASSCSGRAYGHPHFTDENIEGIAAKWTFSISHLQAAMEPGLES